MPDTMTRAMGCFNNMERWMLIRTQHRPTDSDDVCQINWGIWFVEPDDPDELEVHILSEIGESDRFFKTLGEYVATQEVAMAPTAADVLPAIDQFLLCTVNAPEPIALGFAEDIQEMLNMWVRMIQCRFKK